MHVGAPPGLYCDLIVLHQRAAGRRAEGKDAETSETFHTLAGNQTLDFSVGAKDGDASTERAESVV